MYKLLTTAAVIMAVATPSIANQWTGAKDLTQQLETIYGGVDGHSIVDGGGGQFDALQGDFGGNDGQLADFFSTVDQGVTYITLNVDPVTNNISTDINKGVAFSTIQEKQDNLVNRVNFDLFVQDSANADTNIQTYNNDSTYTTVRTVINGDGSNTQANDYAQDTTQGLVGRKVDKLITEVNAVNDFLIDVNTTETQSQNFIAAFPNGVDGVDGDGNPNDFGGSLEVINGHISGFNTSINAASNITYDVDGNPVVDGDGNVVGSVFGNLPIDGLNSTNVNSFLIPSFNDPGNIGNIGAGNYTSISNWANSIQSVTVDAGTGTLSSAGTVTVTDAGAGTISVDLEGVITNYTYDAGVFVAN